MDIKVKEELAPISLLNVLEDKDCWVPGSWLPGKLDLWPSSLGDYVANTAVANLLQGP